ncbi:MAG TPA: translation elongation factor 4, partial [Luteolibacter sp.]|nr:translation elongation factor 4 [Luteolibacter sp.]
MATELTRNFSIIAHIDHGKTTLSDRLMEATSTVTMRESSAQQLDSMDLEREKGITIKAHPVAMKYKAKDGKTYKLNLLDTPGHVDFSYEVARSLAACEGAILMVDAAQGVEAQTVANLHLAHEQNLTIIPVLNKIDLPAADVPKCKKQLEDILCIPAEDCIPASAKAGIGIEDILEAIVHRVPAPVENPDKLLRASVFDSIYDTYRGVVSYVRVFSGAVKKGQRVRLFATGNTYEVKEVGVFTPKMTTCDVLVAGDVGYVIANMKSADEAKIGDTLTDNTHPCPEPLPGYKEIQPMVFSGIYPVESADYEALKAAMAKLQINDAAFTYSSESSTALGFGFRCGFLGLLHMEIIQERLRREYEVDIITTYPAVIYRVFLTSGEMLELDNPTKMPDPSSIEHIEEPMIKAHVICP